MQLIKLLNENCSNGLTWFWHCNPCKELKTNFIAKTELSEISQQLEYEMKQDLATIKDEMKAEIDALRSTICSQINQLESSSQSIPAVVETKLNEITKEVGTQGTNFNEKFVSYAKQVAKTLERNTETNSHLQDIKKSFAGISSNLQSKKEIEIEKQKIEARQLNVCVFNVPEPISDFPH